MYYICYLFDYVPRRNVQFIKRFTSNCVSYSLDFICCTDLFTLLCGMFYLPISPFSKTVVIHTSTAWITNKSKFVINPILLLPNAHSLCTYFSALITGTHTKRTAYITNYLLLGAQKARAYNETQEPIRY